MKRIKQLKLNHVNRMSSILNRQHSSDSEFRSHKASSMNPYAKKKSPPHVPHRLGWVKSTKSVFDLARECGVPEEVARDNTLLNIYREVITTNRDIGLTDDEIRVLRCYRRSLERFNESMKKGIKAKPFVHTPPTIYRRARTAGFPHFIATNFHLLERLFLSLPREDEKRWMEEYKITLQNFREAGGVMSDENPQTHIVMDEPMNLEQMFSEYDSFGTSPTSSLDDSLLSRSSSDSSDNSSEY